MQYVNTLKPKYSSVDLTEVELPEMENNVNNAHNNEEREEENTSMLNDVCVYILCRLFLFLFLLFPLLFFICCLMLLNISNCIGLMLFAKLYSD